VHLPDQAAGLREIMALREESDMSGQVRVIAISSGKGGVGKTSLAINLGIVLQRMGRRVLLFDADLGLANVDIMLGLAPKQNLSHVLRGDARLEEILLEGPAGMQILPASSGVEEILNLSSEDKMRLLNEVDGWSTPVDYMIIDTSAGMGDSVVHFNLSAHMSLVVVTPEPTSFTDAYALIKVLSQNHGMRRFMLLFNQVKGQSEADALFERFLKVSDQFLDVSLDTLGYVVADRGMSRSIRRQRPLVELSQSSEAVECLRRIARRLDRLPFEAETPTGGLSFFWRRMTMGAAAEAGGL
jgi:flagellar biosynthesis protein FlhG